ncbi:MAG: aldo/keto reductase [Nanoarchaeota archaeon]
MENEFELGNGVKIPALGLGTWQSTGNDVYWAVKYALEEGYIHIDTAEMYENEAEIGKAIADVAREKIFITSKLWMSNLDYDKAHEALKGSLERLGTNYLDLYLIHWPSNDMDIEGTFKAFKEMLDSGKVKAVGVSNFTVEHLKTTLPFAKKHGITISANQVEYHPGLNQQELLHFCTENNIRLIAYSPLARGKIFEMDILSKIAGQHNKTVGQVSLRWLLQKGLAVIPKASSKEHIKENKDIFDFELRDEEMTQIDEMGNNERILNPGFAMFDEPLKL